MVPNYLPTVAENVCNVTKVCKLLNQMHWDKALFDTDLPDEDTRLNVLNYIGDDRKHIEELESITWKYINKFTDAENNNLLGFWLMLQTRLYEFYKYNGGHPLVVSLLEKLDDYLVQLAQDHGFQLD